MGLDMYLSVSKYVGNWSHSIEEEKTMYNSIIKAIGLPEETKCEGSPHLTVEINICYWRKANAIHAWFVKNVQDGKDECQKAYVEKSQLQKLLDVCENIKKDHSQAAFLLPTQSGFFFGSTEYGEDYFYNIDSTIEQIKTALKSDFEDFEFYYHSSW
jgi:hypothetical protein